MYYVVRPTCGSFLLYDSFQTYKDAEEHRKKFKDSGKLAILKDSYKENEYGCPEVYPFVTDQEIHGD